MVKGIIAFIGFGLLVVLLVFNTPVIKVGSGFMVGDGRHVITYKGLILGAKSIIVRFPNEDDIEARTVYFDSESNIAIIKLDQEPKVKRAPLVFADGTHHYGDNYVFTLGYPWTNTQGDQYRLIEGSLDMSKTLSPDLLNLDMSLDPVHSGSPLLNAKGEVIGMILMTKHTDGLDRYCKKSNCAVGVKVLKHALKKSNIYKDSLSKITQEGVEGLRHFESIKSNVILIEAS